MDTESTGASNRRFTSYDRSAVTGLDYAKNRHYDAQQGRFTQVDPVGMKAASPADPQSLNLFAYCGNDPVNRLDSAGLFWGKLIGWIGKILRVILVAVGVAMIAIAIATMPGAGLSLGFILEYMLTAGSLIATGLGASKVGRILGFAVRGVGLYFQTPGIITNLAQGAQNQAYIAEQARIKQLIAIVNQAILLHGDKLRRVIEENRDHDYDSLSTNVILCQAAKESGLGNLVDVWNDFESKALGGAGEIGFLQLKPATANGAGLGTFTIEQLQDVGTNIRVSTSIVAGLANRYQSLRTGLIVYNEGVGNYAKKGAFDSSANYADDILGCAEGLIK